MTVANRSHATADALAAVLPGLRVVPWVERSALTGFGLLVNAMTPGMVGHEALAIALDDAPAGLVVADIVAAQRITPLLQDAARLGLPAIEGIGMLLHQAVPGFAAWFGVTPPSTPPPTAPWASSCDRSVLVTRACA